VNAQGKYSAVTHIRDPIHGEIGLNKIEYKIIDNRHMRRLRDIKQLGVVRMVYPSATHTRFEHSLGVMHVSGLLANSIGLCNQKIAEARLAGLLHDVGHGPFSHTSERALSSERHEEISVDIVREICSKYPLSSEQIIRQIRGKADINIVSGTVDADKLDYLLRDSLFTAVDHGLVDIKSILRFSEISDGRLTFNKKAIPSLNNLLSARQRMNRVVYRYPTVRHFDTLLSYAIKSCSDTINKQDVMTMDDTALKSRLIETDNKFYKQIREREHSRERMKIGLNELSKDELSELSSIKNTEILSEVCNVLSYNRNDVLISRPNIPDSIFESIVINSDGLKYLEEVSHMPKYIERQSWENTELVIYVPKSKQKDRVISSIKSILS
jgi:hypothetical protein